MVESPESRIFAPEGILAAHWALALQASRQLEGSQALSPQSYTPEIELSYICSGVQGCAPPCMKSMLEGSVKETGGSGESSHRTSVLSLTPPSASRLPWIWKAALPPPKTSKVPGPKKWRLCDAPVHHH